MPTLLVKCTQTSLCILLTPSPNSVSASTMLCVVEIKSNGAKVLIEVMRGMFITSPIVADAEAGFGGVLNAFELMKGMIRAGCSGVHFEDQLAAVKKCGHLGGKVLVPTREAIAKRSEEHTSELQSRGHIVCSLLLEH